MHFPSIVAITAALAAGSAMAQDGGGEDMPLDLSSNTYNRIVLVHLLFVIMAWLILAPAAILVSRYGRTLFKWYPHHRNLQIGTLVFFIIGFGLGIEAATPAPLGEQTHYQVGVAIFIIVWFQAALGLVAHRISGRRWIGLIHAPVGLILFGLAVWNMETGFSLWTAKGYDSGRAPMIVVYAWMGLLVLAYIIGFAFLPREIKQNREWNNNKSLNEKDGQPMISTTSTHSHGAAHSDGAVAAAPPIDGSHLESGRETNSNSFS
ncbi:hypothetical protein CBS101457_006851 [Exobasidium rhododendri]|nr:hypothetical protein CBS101457_006851 [Exobasidium rhododendri]